MTGSVGFVVAVEEIVERRIKGRVAWALGENEGFKKPRCVRSVPFSGTDVIHRLQRLVRVTERRSKLFCP